MGTAADWEAWPSAQGPLPPQVAFVPRVQEHKRALRWGLGHEGQCKALKTKMEGILQRISTKTRVWGKYRPPVELPQWVRDMDAAVGTGQAPEIAAAAAEAPPAAEEAPVVPRRSRRVQRKRCSVPDAFALAAPIAGPDTDGWAAAVPDSAGVRPTFCPPLERSTPSPFRSLLSPSAGFAP